MTIGFIPEAKTMADITSSPCLGWKGFQNATARPSHLNNVRFDLFAGEVHALMGKTARVNPR